jgi:hypothetical protein
MAYGGHRFKLSGLGSLRALRDWSKLPPSPVLTDFP